MDKNRNEFEAWWVTRPECESGDFQRDEQDQDEYAMEHTHAAWCSWQASRKQALEEAAQFCEAYGDVCLHEDQGLGDHGLNGSAKGAHECATAIRSLEGNAKETT